MKKFISSLMVFITSFSLLPNVLAGKNGMPFKNINDPEYVKFLKDCDTVVENMSILLLVSNFSSAGVMARKIDMMYLSKHSSYMDILELYSKLVKNREYRVCVCRHFAAYAFLELHNINKRCFLLELNDKDRTRRYDHSVAIYSVIENDKEVWKVCDIQTAITYKKEGSENYKEFLSMDLINYLDKTKIFGTALAMDDPEIDDNIFIKQNANDLKLYLAKYTPNYARNFIQDMRNQLHIRNINKIYVSYGTSPEVLGVEESKRLIEKQHNFLLDFAKGVAKPDEAPNV